ncbi:helix-turn-helix transcriptional regulator [Paenibacillus luteus]|uniref:helix-turn-helix transcriptional regulator n=1 Tax=Paenibacillus luteus TaxID=2545753 RepID=UPI001F501726|nr:AraC family transcriptional regulator [Paenibacillus luteus]
MVRIFPIFQWKKEVIHLFENMKEDYHELLEIHYFTPSAFEKSGAAWPIRLGANIAKANYHIGPRITPYYYLIMVLEGEGTFIQGGHTYTLRKKDLFCLFPQVTHEYYTTGDKLLRKAFFAFDGKLALQLLERIGLGPYHPHLEGGLTDEAFAHMESFFYLVMDKDRQHTDLARLALFHQIFDALSVNQTRDKHLSETGSWLRKAKDYLEIHYADGITIESVADYVGIDRTHFSKQFSKTYGLSPMKYVQKLRMNEAILLLKQTDYKLAEIAQSVGYPDLFSFSKAFKKQIGISPALYRKE